jgi:predicted nucleotidyltransferase
MIEQYALARVVKSLIAGKQERSIRETARDSNVNPTTAQRSLRWLESKNIAKKKIIGRSHLYTLNQESITARHLKILLSLWEIEESGLIQELKTKYPQITSIILYGSAARGEDTPKSDLDLLAISLSKIKIQPLKAEEKLPREVTYLSYTTSEWRRKAGKDKPFYDRIIAEGIPLYGEKPLVL